MYGVWCVVYGVWCMVHGVWFMEYGVWCMVYGAWCVVCGVWCMVYDVWRKVYGVWCIVYGVRCMAWGVRCMVHGVGCMVLDVGWSAEGQRGSCGSKGRKASAKRAQINQDLPRFPKGGRAQIASIRGEISFSNRLQKQGLKVNAEAAGQKQTMISI